MVQWGQVFAHGCLIYLANMFMQMRKAIIANVIDKISH